MSFTDRPYADPCDKRNAAVYHTGKECITEGCGHPAGTWWSPYWCFKCNTERIDKITAQVEAIKAKMEAKHGTT